MVIARSNRKMWFGTQDYSCWVTTPLSGADTSPSGWVAEGTYLNGGGFALNSPNSHKRYQFDWSSASSREEAQTMKSFYDGSFGTGKMFFQDPLTHGTNVLPARWADPASTSNFAGPQLVPGVDPVSSPAQPGWLRLPVREASFVFSGNLGFNVGGTSFEVVETNYAPRIEGSGTWAEVRKNFIRNPSLSDSTTGWTAYHTATFGDSVNDGRNVALDPAGGSSNTLLYTATTSEPEIAEGEPVSASMKVEVPAGQPAIELRLSIYWRGNGTFSDGESFLIPAGASEVLTVTGVAPSGATHARFTLVRVSASVVQEITVYDNPVLEISPTTSGLWSGASKSGLTLDYPDDFRVRWIGEPSRSESVVEIEEVAGFTAVNSVAGYSLRDGEAKLRQIVTGSALNSYCQAPVQVQARAAGSLLATRFQDQLIPPTGSGTSRYLWAGTPNFNGPGVNRVGEQRLRLTFGPLTGYNRFRLGHGGSWGSGDVWWSKLGLYAGDYRGPFWNGDSGTVVINGETLQTRWIVQGGVTISQAGRYKATGTVNVNNQNALFIPIPDDHELHLGAFYSSTREGAGVYASGAGLGGKANNRLFRLDPLQSTIPNSRLFSASIRKQPGEIGVYLWLGKTTSASATIAVHAMHARISPINKPVPNEPLWYGGQGNAGVRFNGPPTYLPQSGAEGGKIEFSASFIESVI